MSTRSREQHGHHADLTHGFEARIQRGIARRGAFPYLASTTALLALGAGVLARLTDRSDFPSYGDGIWWALVTMTTVGYGDIVPHTAWGRVIGGFVMILGITFLAFLTANVTSLFISSEDQERDASRADQDTEIRATLRRIEERLTAIEARIPAQP